MEVEEAYSYLHEILSEGFITLGIRYKDFNIVLKSLTDKEILYLKKKNNTLLYSAIPIMDKLCYSTYFIDGINCLLEREFSINSISEYYSNVSPLLLNRVKDKVEELLDIFLQCSVFLEGFCYTESSRALWRLMRDSTLRGGEAARLSGSIIVDRWAQTNILLDREESDALNTELAVFVASAFNPKGVKSASSAIKSKRDELAKERLEISEFGYSKRRIDAKVAPGGWSKPLVTNEDLVRELNKNLKGVKDRHDLFIDNWIKKKAEIAEEKRRDREAAALRFRKDFDEKSLDVEGSRKASTLELKNMFDRGRGKRVYTERYSSAYEHIGKSDDFMKRVGSRVLK